MTFRYTTPLHYQGGGFFAMKIPGLMELPGLGGSEHPAELGNGIRHRLCQQTLELFDTLDPAIEIT